MKTQIITLAAHDDLISVRDRMSWAKTPRILLVWPGYEKVPLRPLDLRLLQEHAARLGAQLGLVARRSQVGRDARAFGIPVFSSTKEAQREAWVGRAGAGRRLQRSPVRSRQLRDLHQSVLRSRRAPSLRPAARFTLFSGGVVAGLAIALIFVPRASVSLVPVSQLQTATIPFEIVDQDTRVRAGDIPLRRARLTVEGVRSMPVGTRTELPQSTATGAVEFRNRTEGALVIPAGTVVFSLEPDAARFVTLEEADLDGGTTATSTTSVEALDPGEAGNVPESAVRGIEGPLGAVIDVTNPAPMTGGQDATAYVPSEADRESLKLALLQDLENEARTQFAAQTDAADVLVSESLRLAEVEREVFDPAAGQPGGVLDLEIAAIFVGAYLDGEDLQELAELALDSTLPTGFEAGSEAKVLFLGSGEAASDHRLRTERKIVRKIDLASAGMLVRGMTETEALRILQSALPLAKPPTIKLWPAWWPRLPLVPFRIETRLGR